MVKKKSARLLPKLTKVEQDLLSHSQDVYQLKPIRLAAIQFFGGRKTMKKCVLCPPVAISSKRWNNADSSLPAKVETC